MPKAGKRKVRSRTANRGRVGGKWGQEEEEDEDDDDFSDDDGDSDVDEQNDRDGGDHRRDRSGGQQRSVSKVESQPTHTLDKRYRTVLGIKQRLIFVAPPGADGFVQEVC